MPRTRNEIPHLVEESRNFEQEPLALSQPVHVLQLIEERECEGGDVPRVLGVVIVLLHDRVGRVQGLRGLELLLALGARHPRQIQEHAVHQPHEGDHDLAHARALCNMLEDHAGGNDHVGAVRPQVVFLGALLGLHAGQLLDQLLQAAQRHRDRLPLQIVLLSLALAAARDQGRERLDVPSGSHHLRHPMAPKRLEHREARRAQPLAQDPEQFVPRGASHLLQETDRAQIVRFDEEDLPLLQERELGGSASHVHDQRRPTQSHLLAHAERDEASLLGALDQLEVDAGLRVHALQKGAAVLRLARRAGRDGPVEHHVVLLHHRAEFPEGVQRLVQCVGIDAAGLEHRLPQPHGNALSLENPVVGGTLEFGDGQAQGVAPHVHSGAPDGKARLVGSHHPILRHMLDLR